MFKNIVLTKCVLLLCSVAYGQYPLEERYTIQDGLKMTEIRQTMQDQEGYVWTLSVQGDLSRFDGASFINYSEEELGGFRYKNLQSLDNGDILASNNTVGKYAILKGDTIQTLSEIPGGAILPIRNFHSEQLMLASGDSLYYYSGSTYQIDSIVNHVGLGERNIDWGFVLPNKDFLVGKHDAEEQAFFIAGPHKGQAIFIGLAYRGIFTIEGQLYVYDHHKELITEYDSDYNSIRELDINEHFERDRRQLWLLDMRGKPFFLLEKPEDNGNRSSLELYDFELKDGQIHTTLINRYKKNSLLEAKLFLDDQGIIWTPSHTGLRKILPNSQAFYSSDPQMIPSLHTLAEGVNGEIYFGGYGSGFGVFDGTNIRRLTPSPLHSSIAVLPGHYKDTQGNLYFFIEERQLGCLVQFSPTGKIRNHALYNPPMYSPGMTGYHFSESTLPYNIPLFNQSKGGEGTFLTMALAGSRPSLGVAPIGNIAFWELPFSADGTPYYIGHEEGITFRNVHCTAQDKAGRVWFGQSSGGIGVYEPLKNKATCWNIEQAADPGARCIAIDSQDRVWFGSDQGLLYVDHASAVQCDTSKHIRSQTKKVPVPDLQGVMVTSLLLQNDTLIVGHTNGVSFILLDQKTSEQLSIEKAVSFNFIDFGLGSAEQNALLVDKEGWLWIGTDEGALRLDYRNFLRTRFPPNPISVRVGADNKQTIIPIDGKFKLPIGDRTLNYSIIRAPLDNIHRNAVATVVILNAKGDTVAINQGLYTSSDFRHPYLDPGTYQVKSLLSQDNNLISTDSVIVKVPKRLREQWWFWVGLIALVSGLVITYQRLRINRTRAQLMEEELKLELQQIINAKDEMQVSTLVSTINPHFISNAIQWMQSASATKRNQDDIDDIAFLLSDIIRTIFTKSFDKRAAHTLRDEIQLVDNYLSTINMQYDNRYTFVLPSDEMLDRVGHYNVLLMQIQIHAENAVERGLMNRRKGEKVQIGLREDESFIYIVIEDEGAGMDRVAKMTYSTKRSAGRGTRIMLALQDVFNKRNALKLSTVVESPLYDELDDSGQKFGTRVTVTVPKEYSYVIESTGGGG
ncbi:MAG: histidine kinase [Bacteroidota bacterium]